MGCGGGCGMLGSLIVSPGGVSPVYTKAKPRGGEAALVSLSVLEFVSAGTALVVAVETKNSDETSWSTVGTFAGITAAGTYSKDMSGFKQSVRMLLHFATGSAQGDTARIGAIHFSWRPY